MALWPSTTTHPGCLGGMQCGGWLNCTDMGSIGEWEFQSFGWVLVILDCNVKVSVGTYELQIIMASADIVRTAQMCLQMVLCSSYMYLESPC